MKLIIFMVFIPILVSSDDSVSFYFIRVGIPRLFVFLRGFENKNCPNRKLQIPKILIQIVFKLVSWLVSHFLLPVLKIAQQHVLSLYFEPFQLHY